MNDLLKLLDNIPELTQEELEEIERKNVEQESFMAAQRVERGWDERAFWDTGRWLAKTLGEILTYAADDNRLVGWPSNAYETYEEWVALHAKHGAALTAWRVFEDSDEYYALPHNEARDKLNALYAEAQEAIHWVADNLHYLWD